MTIILDALDEKILKYYRGYVVKKDLVQILKVGQNVPVFVLEYLIANSCSRRVSTISDDLFLGKPAVFLEGSW